MRKFGLKGIITDEKFVTIILNKMSKEYDVIFDGLESSNLK